MPYVSEAFLGRLLAQDLTDTWCVIPIGPSGEPEPLCALYHIRCLPAMARAIEDKRLKMRDLVAELKTELRPFDAAALANVNTPGEWAEFEEQSR